MASVPAQDIATVAAMPLAPPAVLPSPALRSSPAVRPRSDTDSSSGRFDADPDSALDRLARHRGPVILDLDETLYLRNSTEDFLDCARPGLVALLILRALDVIKPWRFTGGLPTRDVWRVRVIGALLPWTWNTWRVRAPRLAQRFGNRPLLDGLGSVEGHLIISTLGFEPIVTPLLRAMGLEHVHLFATRGHWMESRRQGKLALLERVLGRETVAQALVLTDSTDDLDLLDRCACPLRTRWPTARYRRALAHVYLPGEYLTHIKRPGERYIARSILREDFACWLFASLALTTSFPTHVVGLLLLLASFWAVYELGYMDNDEVGAKYEKDPKLSRQFFESPTPHATWQPWLWSVVLGTLGLWVLRYPERPAPFDIGRWYAALAATFLWFRLYNRLDKSTRIWMFLGLQFARVTAFSAVVSIAPVAVAGLAASVLGRWMSYYRYRVEGAWPHDLPETARLVFYVIIAALLGVSGGFAVVANWTTVMFLAWYVVWARKELRTILTGVSRIDSEPKRNLQSLTEVSYRRS
jgi:hypothetical protein